MRKLSWKNVVALLVLAVVTTGQACQADSLWQRRSPQRASLFEDVKARRVGDLLTIVISESTEVRNSEDNSMSKQTSAGGTFDLDTQSTGGLGAQSASANFDSTTTSNREFDGEAAYRDSRRFTDQVTVSVVDVLPNGNLVVSGTRCLMIAGEKRTLVVSGVVRPYDIGTSNSVSSRLVADFRSVYDGDGPPRHFTHQGWLGRAVNKVWPF
jgi:flagellar L-ring protein FlgH